MPTHTRSTHCNPSGIRCFLAGGLLTIGWAGGWFGLFMSCTPLLCWSEYNCYMVLCQSLFSINMLGMTNKEIAEKTGIPASNLSRWKHLGPTEPLEGAPEPNHRFTLYTMLLDHPEMVELMEKTREQLKAKYARGS